MIAEQTQDRAFMDVPATGRKVTFEIYEIVRIADSRIAERWVALKPGVQSRVSSKLRPERPEPCGRCPPNKPPF